MDRRIFFDDRRVPYDEIDYGQVLITLAMPQTISLNINVIISYVSIFLIPFLIGLYQVIKIEND